MILVKTEKARVALAERRALTPRERQLLLLADGRRSRHDLAQLLGAASDALLQRLLLDGYLVRAAPAAASAHGWARAGEPQAQAATPPRASAPAHGPGPAPAMAATDAPAQGARRSLAGSKMYMVGLLQMLRDNEAAALAVGLHGAQDGGQLRHGLVGSLLFLHRRSGADYAARVTARLLEVLPHDALEPLCQALVDSGLPPPGARAPGARAVAEPALA